MIKAYKIDSRRNLALEKRDLFGISAKEMTILRQLYQGTLFIAVLLKKLKRRSHHLSVRKEKALKKIIALLLRAVQHVLEVEVPVNPNPLPSAFKRGER